MTSYVIDTNVFLYAKKRNEGLSAIITILEHIMNLHSISVDCNYEILNQYQETGALDMNPLNMILCYFWKHMMYNEGKIIFISPFLEDEHQKKLQYLGFDSSDLIFIKVAYNSTDRIIITKDSDFGIKTGDNRKFPQIKRYLESKLKIQTLEIEEAKEHVKT